MKRLLLTIVALVAFLAPSAVLSASVVPSVLELEGERSELVSSSITVINPNDNDQTYYMNTMGFEADEDGQSPTFYEAAETSAELANWIRFTQPVVVVPAHSQAEIPFEIYIPDSAQNSGHYAAVTVSSAPYDVVASNGAIVEAKTAVLVLLSVGGVEMNAQAVILDLVAIEGKSFRSLVEGEFEFRIQNQGNVHVMPQGTLLLKDVFGRVLASTSVNKSEGRVLPGSTRTYSASLDSQATGWVQMVSEQMRVFSAGPITAQLELEYAGNERMSMQISAFWLVPWQLLVTLLGALVILIVVFRLGRRKRK